MQQFVGALALIRRDLDGRTQWLTQWNPARGCFRFIEAAKLDEESFRDSLDREIAWASSLRQGKDYLVSSAPRAHLEVEITLPGGSETCWMQVEFYLAELMGRSALKTIDGDDRHRWMTATELLAGRTEDERPFDPLHQSLLTRCDAVQPWE